VDALKRVTLWQVHGDGYTLYSHSDATARTATDWRLPRGEEGGRSFEAVA